VKLFIPLAFLYIGLVVLANWLAATYIVDVGFGYQAPAGVFAIGAVLVLRDWIQQLAGLWPTMAMVYAAGLISWAIGEVAGWTSLERIALASVVAFSVSETVEALVFTPIRNRSLTAGVGLSATVGTAIDSFLFLWIAFGSEEFFAGQVIGKLWMVAAGTALTLVRRRVLAVASVP
jgi:queuosine precursor transporter